MSSSRLIQFTVIGLQMLICCGLCPPPSSTEVMEVIAQTTLELKAAVDREMAELCGGSDTNSSCDEADILLDTLTRQHTETLKFQVKDKFEHDCTDSSVDQTTEGTETTSAEPSENANEVIERTIQRRISNSVNFDRDWDDYVTGFGEEDGNYWMGLEEIHQLTTTHDVSLDMNIETFEGEPFTLTLQTFSVGDAASNYAIYFSGYSQSSDRVKGSAFRSIDNGLMFTTRDRDNDLWSSGNCASDSLRGGWWYYSCAWINLNGNYEGDVTFPTYTGIIVRFIDTASVSPSASKAVKSVEMIIRTRVE